MEELIGTVQTATITAVKRTGDKHPKSGAPVKECAMVITSQDPPLEVTAWTTEFVEVSTGKKVKFIKGNAKYPIGFTMADGTGRADQKPPNPERVKSGGGGTEAFLGDLEAIPEDKLDDVKGMFNQQQIEVMRRTNVIPADTPEPIILMFLHVCVSRKLDPLAKEIHLQAFSNSDGTKSYTIIVPYDGMRKKAALTGELAGIGKVLFDGLTMAEWVKTNGPASKTKHPEVAEVTIYRRRQGSTFIEEYHGAADWASFCPSERKAKMWYKYPFRMLGKCSKVDGIKDGFMDAIGAGIYTEEEVASMQGAALPAPAWSGIEPEPALKAIEAASNQDDLAGIREQFSKEFETPLVATAWNSRFEELEQPAQEAEIVQP